MAEKTHLLSIPRHIDDRYYRYKMHDLILKHENQNTLLVNIETIAKELGRSVELLMKCFSLHLGTPSNPNKNKQYLLKG